jgi:hypothetical protein
VRIDVPALGGRCGASADWSRGSSVWVYCKVRMLAVLPEVSTGTGMIARASESANGGDRRGDRGPALLACPVPRRLQTSGGVWGNGSAPDSAARACQGSTAGCKQMFTPTPLACGLYLWVRMIYYPHPISGPPTTRVLEG